METPRPSAALLNLALDVCHDRISCGVENVGDCPYGKSQLPEAKTLGALVLNHCPAVCPKIEIVVRNEGWTLIDLPIVKVLIGDYLGRFNPQEQPEDT